MPAQDWFESFFIEGRYAEQLERVPAEQTEREVAFIGQALQLPEGARVLDLCCGVGRHTVPLAMRGYRVAGLDLDGVAIGKARERAREAGVAIEWHQADMRDIPYRGELDAVISWFSSWGYYETDAEDAEVLAAVASALKPGGRFLLEVANREAVFSRSGETEWHEDADGALVLTRRELDLAAARDRVTELVIHPDGRRSERWRRVRRYSLTELSLLLDGKGLGLERTWGDVDGSPYTPASRRLIVLARKPAEKGHGQ